MRWRLSHRFDPAALPLANRHYNRQTPDSPQFVPPGRCIVLVADRAVWVTSWPYYAQHRWVGAWINTLFRKECGGLASEFILEAIAATRFFWSPPALGIVTFVAPDAIRHKRDPGRCYRRAGFLVDGVTEVRRRLALRLTPEAMPKPEPPLGATLPLFPCP